MDWRVVLFDVDVGDEEIAAVAEVLRSRWLSVGAVTAAFEQEFAAAHGVPAAVAVSSGTAALHLAAQALGLGPDDEVIMPSLTFVASAATMLLVGARPVFAEIKGPHDLTLDPDDVARRITPRTRAIVAMHYGGYAADMVALRALAEQHNLWLIEDAAHAPQVSTTQGMLGTLGDIGCFSFFSTKNMTTGEGGMVVARDPAVLSRVRSLRAHCMTTSSWDKHHGRSSSYDVDGVGLNYRPTDISSALGRIQLRKLRTDRERRAALVQQYRALLAPTGLELPFAEREGDSAHHLFPLLLPADLDRSVFQEQLKAAGIQSSVHYPPIHLFSYYRAHCDGQPGSLPRTEDVTARVVSLPLHVRMSKDQVELVAQTVRAAVAGRSRERGSSGV